MAVVGIDIGGTTAKLGLVADGAILARGQVATGRDLPFEELLSRLAAAVRDLLTGPLPTGIGVAAPGFPTPDRSGVVNVSNLPDLDGKPLRERLQEATGLPVAVDNDANAAALGEYFHGAGRGARRLLVVTIGTGIGAGMVVDGVVLRTAWQGLGDPGHLVVLRDGPRCACGAAGCLEAIAAVPATLRRAAESGIAPSSFPELAAMSAAGEVVARDALAESGRWIGVGLATWTHLLGPERVLFGGGAIDGAAAILLPAIEQSYRHHVQPFLGKEVRLGRAALGNDAGVIGAAAVFASASP